VPDGAQTVVDAALFIDAQMHRRVSIAAPRTMQSDPAARREATLLRPRDVYMIEQIAPANGQGDGSTSIQH
jgi:hypothetical protein